MKVSLRLIVLMFAISTTLSVYSLSSLTTSVNAFCQTGWAGCISPNGDRTAAPGNRSGCSVRYAGDYNDGESGLYIYTCNGEETRCYYRFRCPPPGVEDTPPN